MGRRIIWVGEIEDDCCSNLTPLEWFKLGLDYFKKEEFSINTNNPQLIELLEVLCGEENIEINIILNNECTEVSFLTAYNYLGDFYDTIDSLRLFKSFEIRTDGIVERDVNEYIEKYGSIEKIKGING